jgi:hypothetical protein
MADTSTLTDQQVADAAVAGADRVVVAAVTRKVVFADTTFTFYSPDAASPQSGTRCSIRNREFGVDIRLDDIAGAGSQFAITAEDKACLLLVLQKLHVGCVMP